MRSWTRAGTNLAVAGALTVLAVAACSPEEGAGTTTTITSTTAAPSTSTTPTIDATTTTVAATTTTTGLPVEEWELAVATDVMPEGWTLAFEIPYGEADEQLGTAPGGENLMLGPDYGAQGPDGTWWILDGAKKRLAHYDENGTYLDAVVLPEDLLAQGIYFQYQLPHVLADGTLVATRLVGESTDLLRLIDGEPTIGNVDGTYLIRTDDGNSLYGFDLENRLYAIDPLAPAATTTDWFLTQTGAQYAISVDGTDIVVELPDAGMTTTLPLTSPLGPEPVHASIEVATGADGVIHLFLLGISEADESVQLAGYATVGADGTPTAMEPMINPFTPADPGSPGHLGVAYGSSTAWIMLITEDGLEVYLRD
jgi:hypothetical protein